MPASRLVRIAAALISVGIAVVLALGLSEILLRVAVPANTQYHVVRPGTEVVFHPRADIYNGITGPSHYVVNKAGIRGGEPTPNEPQYRMLAVGGSTTQLLYLDGPETWPWLVQHDLAKTQEGEPVWVGNVGMSGTNARDHVVHVKYLLPQHPNLDAILMLVGVNDLTVALSQADHYKLPAPITDSAAERAQVRTAFAIAPGKLHQPATEVLISDGAPWFKRLALYQLVKRARMVYTSWEASRGLAQDDRGEILDVWRAHRRTATTFIDSLPPLELPLTEYRTNLEAIASIAKVKGVRLVMMTQPVLWRADLSADEQKHLWLGGTGNFQVDSGQAYYTPRVLADAMHRYNAVTLEVCTAQGVECIDLESVIPRDTAMFYDDVHFTERGSQAVAAEVTRFLRQKPPFVRAPKQLIGAVTGGPVR